MRRLISIIMILMMSIVPMFSSDTYEIDTAYGKETVVVPDGYTSTDVLLIVSKAYYELNHDYDVLKTANSQLSTSLSVYMDENKALREDFSDIMEKYSTLVKNLEKSRKLGNWRGFVGGHLLYDGQNIKGAGLSAGMLMFGTLLMSATIQFPFTMSLGVGFVI